MNSSLAKAPRQRASDLNRHREFVLSKVPEVTLVFWIIKIAATTLGETGGDSVTMTLNWGYLAGTAVFLSLLIVLVIAQIFAKKFHPFLYWATIVASTYLRYRNGRLCRSLSRYRLHRRRCAAVHLTQRHARLLVLVGGHQISLPEFAGERNRLGLMSPNANALGIPGAGGMTGSTFRTRCVSET